jgi:hypothetical protein
MLGWWTKRCWAKVVVHRSANKVYNQIPALAQCLSAIWDWILGIFTCPTKKWPFNTCDCLIEVTAWAGLTILLHILSFLSVFYFVYKFSCLCIHFLSWPLNTGLTVLLFVGLLGSGKSQLALRYGCIFRKDHLAGLCWRITCRSTLIFLNSLKRLADALGIGKDRGRRPSVKVRSPPVCNEQWGN